MEDSEYSTLLKDALAKVPQKGDAKDRFNLAEPLAEVSGQKTIVSNFFEVCGSMRRDPNDVFKFLLKELATKGNIEGQKAVFQGVFTAEQIKVKIDIFVKANVMCPMCKRPDTYILKEKNESFIRCEVCGAKTRLRR